MPTVSELQQNYASQFLKVQPGNAHKNESSSFKDTLSEMIEQVGGLQRVSREKIEDFIAGKDINIHEVMAAGEEAQISFQFLMEIRNKMLEAYQELSRTQV